jgi:opacity protein-like surface antigen
MRINQFLPRHEGNPMTRKLVFAGLMLSALPSAALAEGFGGPFVQVGIGATKAGSDIEFTGWFRDKVNETELNGAVKAGYTHDFGRFTLAASVSHALGGQDAGTTVQNSPFVAEERGDTVAVRLNNRWSVTVEPGVAIGPRGLLHGKIGWSRAQGRWTFSRPLFGDSFTDTMRFDGLAVGVGYKHRLNARLYAFTDAQHTWYARRDVPVTVTTQGTTSTYVDRFGAHSSTIATGLGVRF